ncbi:MAG: MFS transporter [Clostridiales bacterium]|nr:MFS transporter [Clostridiales bacterium]
MKKDKPQMHYAWKIVIACILMKVGTGGACMAAIGNFIAPITSELGCQVSQFTMFTSIQAVSMALLYTTAARFLITKRIGLVIGFASVLEVIGLALMSTYRTVEMFYISGAMIGIAQAFTGFVTTPIILNMWFRKKNGTVLGIVTAIGTAATMLYTLLSVQLITAVGWRNAYLIMAAMATVITIPGVFILIKSPEEVGCKPYGADEEADDHVAVAAAAQDSAYDLTRKQAFRMPLLYIAWAACVLYSYGSGIAGYSTSFATMELKQTINFGALVGVISSLGGTLGSLAVGRINDKFGIKAGLLWGTVTTGLGYMLMFLSYRNPIFVYVAIFIVGLGSSMYMVQCPLLARNIVGTKHYSQIWSLMMMINSLIGGGLYASIGLFYDKLGSYRGAFVMGIALYAAAAILGSISIALSKKRRTNQQSVTV